MILHYNNEYDIHMSSKICEESGYYLNLEFVAISYQSHVSYPRRSGLVGNSNHLRPIYLNIEKIEHFVCKTLDQHSLIYAFWSAHTLDQQFDCFLDI